MRPMVKSQKPAIAIDVQTTGLEKTGFGFYVSNLIEHLPTVAPEFSYAFLSPETDETDFTVPRRFWWDQIEVPARLRRLRPDLFHQPAFSIPLLKPRRTRVVVTIHDLIPRLFGKDIPYWSRQYFARWMPFTYRLADHVIVDSEHTRKDLIRELDFPEDKVSVIHLAASDAYRPLEDPKKIAAIKRKYKIPGRYAANIGTLNPRKNLEFLVEAFAGVASHFPDLSLVVSGKFGWYYDRLFDLVETLGLKERVIFAGYVPEEDKATLLAGAEIFLFPSLYEGFGLPPLEAMACGVPVISSNTSSLPEVVGEAGILLDPHDHAGWVKAIRNVLERAPLRKQLIERGYRQAKGFSWKRTAAQTAAIYHQVLERGRDDD